jgi:hypothetical protein
MVKQTVITQKRRGPAPTGKGTLIGVRLQPDDLNKIDAYIAKQPDAPSRPEALRRVPNSALPKQKAKR